MGLKLRLSLNLERDAIAPCSIIVERKLVELSAPRKLMLMVLFCDFEKTFILVLNIVGATQKKSLFSEGL